MTRKIKNITILIISFIVFTLIGMCNKEALAIQVGDTVWLTANSTKTMNEYNLASASSSFFCIQEGQPLNADTEYHVINHAAFEGTTRQNYIMSWIAYQKNTDSKPEGADGIGTTPSYSKKQKAIYGYFATWAKAYGWNAPINSGGYTSSWINTASDKYDGWVKAKNASIRNNKTVSSLKKEIYNYNGQSYIKVGPFNFTYTGADPNVTFNITNQNGNRLPVLYGVYSGSTLRVSSGFEAEDYSVEEG